jgi:GTP-binding protein
MNGYAFGLPAAAQRKAVGEKNKTDLAKKEMMKTPTRSARRLLASRLRDTTPDAALVLMDMPGYGLNSRSEWGAEISKYLRRRKLLRGAVLLVDAVAGIKDGDRMVLRLLRDANVRTLVVLTKADKLGYGHGDRGTAQVARMCETVWDQLRDLERGTLTWTEGKGWEAEIWVTGAGDPRSGGGGGVGVEGARFAIARLAGLVQDGRDVTAGASAAAAGLAPVRQQRIVPFEELEWASSRAEV